jgi:hypothetical protein
LGRGGWPRGLGYALAGAGRATRQTADRFFRCKFVTARSNESPKEESSTERWSQKAAEQARHSAAQGESTDEPEIDFSSMPQFDTFEEGNAWLLEQIGEWYVRKSGRWQLFQNSRRVPGFKKAEASWKAASGEFLRREGHRDVVSGPINPEAIFFRQVGLDPAEALVNCHPIVSDAARRGDVAFFRRIVSEIKRVPRRKRQNVLVLHMLNNWLHGFLWLMPSTWGSYYLEKIIGGKVSQEYYQKLRQRLKLVGWEAALEHPPIEGYTPTTGAFTFRKGWTDLNPDLSK